VTEYYPAADMARDGEIDFSYVPTAQMLANCFTKPLLTPTILKQCAPMGKIQVGLGNGLGNGLGIGIKNGLGNGLSRLGYSLGNGIGTGYGHGIGMLSELNLID